MEEKNRNITLKVILGYISIILIAIFSITYVYNTIKEVAGEDEPDNKSRLKVYLITNTLALLYESEALGEIIQPGHNDFNYINQPFDKALRNMDTLRTLITDSTQLTKIDTINLLIEQKRRNTRRLLQTLNEINTGNLYSRNIEKAIAGQDTVSDDKQKIEIRRDSVLVPGKQRKFFRRLADVFDPPSNNSNVVIKSSRKVVPDTTAIASSEKVVSVLKDIKDNVELQRKESSNLLLQRLGSIQYNNNTITNKINQLLRAIEEEEVNASFERFTKKETLLKNSTKLLAFIAVLSIIITAIFLFIIIRDISRSRYYRKQLEKSNQYTENLLHAREKLMLMISHDIRAPLSSIIGYIELLSRLNPAERQRYYLDNMTASSKHILALVNNLLDAHRLESGEMEVHLVPFNLKTLINEIYAGFEPIAEAKGLKILLETKGNLDLSYDIDPILLRQIVGNLLSNAIKFTSEGKITLNVSIREKSISEYFLTITVSDTGPGIPKEEQERIFSEFSRLSQTEQVEGFGLGLSITWKLVELLKGELTLQSIPGKGSDFEVILPITKSETDQIFETQDKELVIQKNKEIHCLLIDDDPFQLAFTEELLKQLGVKVTSCLNPHSILDLLNNTTFDIILTDIQMPHVDGHQLLEQIRNSNIPNTDKIPVIALSASIDKDSDYYIKMGFNGFLNKPFSPNQLITMLNNTLSTGIQQKPAFDYSPLTAFAEDDKEATHSILTTFFEETNTNISMLEKALQEKDRKKASQIAHKVIPVITMMGNSELVASLRTIEENKDNLSEENWSELLISVIKQLDLLTADLKIKIATLG